jgi:hypothetical protein
VHVHVDVNVVFILSGRLQEHTFFHTILSLLYVFLDWGEMGYMRIQAGKNLLGIEGEVAWATPGTFTVHNFPCSEDGSNCLIGDKPASPVGTQFYQDPSMNVAAVHERLSLTKDRSSKKSNVQAVKRTLRA